MIRLQIADDHPATRAGLRAMFAALPHVTLVEPDICEGRNFIGLVQRGDADVLICDVSMPNFDILKALKALQMAHVTTRVLVYSVSVSYPLVQDLLAAGVAGIALKEELLITNSYNVLDVLMQGGLYISQQAREYMQPNPLWEALTPRERDILVLLAQGLELKDVTQQLRVEPSTVYNWQMSLRKKFGVTNNVALLKKAVQLRLVSFGEE